MRVINFHPALHPAPYLLTPAVTTVHLGPAARLNTLSRPSLDSHTVFPLTYAPGADPARQFDLFDERVAKVGLDHVLATRPQRKVVLVKAVQCVSLLL
jgi:hypothetical protein